uniref:uncharacterized protein LOC100185092 isoform X2 n=1 Tax=Ciona intestinalis TaxID=7719 RepID=UPI00089DD47E|nr:uncharacterized protein LOC100185092 isoform X2 [Ciona intestinalis]|eukprot:XP_018672018.1 uncharacterized protein LOC100185092 isoform X2 [Ciona intestinalis]
MGAEESKSFRPQEPRVHQGITQDAYKNALKLEDVRKPVDDARERKRTNEEVRHHDRRKERQEKPHHGDNERKKQNSDRQESSLEKERKERRKNDHDKTSERDKRRHRDKSRDDVTKRRSRHRRTSSRGSTSSDHKELKEKNKQEGKRERKQRSDKSSSRKVGKEGNRKKKKKEKETNSQRSEPNFTTIQNSRVGDWLNSANNFPPQPQYGSNPGNFYGSLPRDMTGVIPGSHELVDGLGYPVGRFQPVQFLHRPDGAPLGVYPGYSPMYDSYAAHGVPGYFPLPYPYMVDPQYLEDVGYGGNPRQKFNSRRHRSKSYNALEEMEADWTRSGHETKQHKKKRSRSMDKSAPSLLTPSSGQYFNDIEPTRKLLAHEDYKANQEIYVDDVTVAHPITVPQTFDDDDVEDMTSSSSSSESESSCNDIIMEEATSPIESSVTSQGVLLFQPISEREVYIDHVTPEKKTENPDSTEMEQNDVAKTETNAETTLPSDRNNNAPIMTLCESESIVATSFLTNQGKVFCLTRTKHEAPVLQGKTQKSIPRKIPSKIEIPKQTDNQEEGVWYGFTGSPPAVRSVHPTTDPKIVKETPKATPTAHISPHPHKTTQDMTSQLPRNLDQGRHHAGTNQPFEHVDKKQSENLAKSRTQLLNNSSQISSETREQPPNNPGFYSLPTRGAKESTGKAPKPSPPQHRKVEITTSVDDLNEGRLFPSISRNAPNRVSTRFNDVKTRNDVNPSELNDVIIPARNNVIARSRNDVKETGSGVTASQGNDVIATTGNDVSASSLRARVESLVSQYCESSSSEDEEPDERYGSSGLGSRLLRIDSRDSINMKRRMKRRTSSQGSFTGFDRRATIGSISQSDLRDAGIRSGLPSPGVNPFRGQDTPDIQPFLQRAKSEEVLKQNLRKSQEVFQFPAPEKKKETLQERAARILGLSRDDLDQARKNKSKGSPGSSGRRAEESVVSNDTSITTVTSLDKTSSEACAISVTNSMLEDKLNQYMVRDIRHDDVIELSNSSDDVSTLSRDSESGAASTIAEVDFSDSSSGINDLERLEVPSLTPTEYKIPDDLFADADSPPTPRKEMGQAGIVASYANSIYDRMPVGHGRNYSDETTESEELDSGDFGNVRATSEQTLKDFGNSDRSQGPGPRMGESPVPIASHSAPLTSAELDIIMQLYNSATDSASDVSRSDVSRNDVTRRGELKRQTATDRRDVTNQNSDVTRRKINEERLNRVARAIGYDVEKMNNKSRKSDENLEKIEDFDIKVFPQRREQVPVTSPVENNENHVIEAMESLGLNPDETWLVSV